MMASVERFGTSRLSAPVRDRPVQSRGASPCLRNALALSALLWLVLGYAAALLF